VNCLKKKQVSNAYDLQEPRVMGIQECRSSWYMHNQ